MDLGDFDHKKLRFGKLDFTYRELLVLTESKFKKSSKYICKLSNNMCILEFKLLFTSCESFTTVMLLTHNRNLDWFDEIITLAASE